MPSATRSCRRRPFWSSGCPPAKGQPERGGRAQPVEQMSAEILGESGPVVLLDRLVQTGGRQHDVAARPDSGTEQGSEADPGGAQRGDEDSVRDPGGRAVT